MSEQFMSELWGKFPPPRSLERTGRDINMSICRAANRRGPRYTQHHGYARRGCGDVWARVKNNALLYATVHLKAWDRMRVHKDTPPVDDGDRCLWLLAAAWRAVKWLDTQDLTQEQVIEIRRLVTHLKAGVSSLPAGFAIDVEEQLREDELERAKPPGPKMRPSKAKKTVYVS